MAEYLRIANYSPYPGREALEDYARRGIGEATTPEQLVVGEDIARRTTEFAGVADRGVVEQFGFLGGLLIGAGAGFLAGLWFGR